MALVNTASNVALGYYMAGGFGTTAAAGAGVAAAGAGAAGAGAAAAGATFAVPAASGAALLGTTGGVSVATGGTLSTMAGTSALGVSTAGSSAGVGLVGGGATAGSAFMAAIPWLAAGAIVYALVSGRKKTLKFRRYNELPRFDLQSDKRSGMDKAYSPMFMSGTSSRQPWQPGSPLKTISSYEYQSSQSQMLGGTKPLFSGLGGVRAGYVKPVALGPGNWSGYTADTNYGSRSKGFVERTAMEEKTMRVKKKRVGSTISSMEAQGWKRI
jgi:hypothetical protein